MQICQMFPFMRTVLEGVARQREAAMLHGGFGTIIDFSRNAIRAQSIGRSSYIVRPPCKLLTCPCFLFSIMFVSSLLQCFVLVT